MNMKMNLDQNRVKKQEKAKKRPTSPRFARENRNVAPLANRFWPLNDLFRER